MSEHDLYQQVILHHNKSPRNFGRHEGCDIKIEARNPLCGDSYDVYWRVEDGRIVDLCFEGTGCAISKASASMMSETLKGKTLDEAKLVFDAFQRLSTGATAEGPDSDRLGKLRALGGVSRYPARVKCAMLAWHALRALWETR